ncbi:MAG: alpha/beta hydrolase fold domain-containing protein [Burkholderiaceae bacterium]|nr:alpha/beta hydrolase fold domain-containing protein [Burkholderiaceae bacterium]
MVERGVPPTHTLGPLDARRFCLERRGVTPPEPRPVAELRDLAAPGPQGPIPQRLYRPAPAPAPAPALVCFHGGGWTMGDLDTHDVLCRQLAAGFITMGRVIDEAHTAVALCAAARRRALR